MKLVTDIVRNEFPEDSLILADTKGITIKDQEAIRGMELFCQHKKTHDLTLVSTVLLSCYICIKFVFSQKLRYMLSIKSPRLISFW